MDNEYSLRLRLQAGTDKNSHFYWVKTQIFYEFVCKKSEFNFSWSEKRVFWICLSEYQWTYYSFFFLGLFGSRLEAARSRTRQYQLIVEELKEGLIFIVFERWILPVATDHYTTTTLIYSSLYITKIARFFGMELSMLLRCSIVHSTTTRSRSIRSHRSPSPSYTCAISLKVGRSFTFPGTTR